MKNKITKFALAAIYPLVFNMIFFMLCGTQNVASTWISYGFMNLSYLLLITTSLFNKNNKSVRVLSMTLYSISAFYFVAAQILGFILICMQSESYTWTLIIQTVLLGSFLFVFLSNYLANEYTKDSMKKSQSESTYINDSAHALKMVLHQISDKKTYTMVEKCYDLMQNSPTQSSSKVKDIETQISNDITTLKSIIQSEDQQQISQLCSNIRLKIEERNSTLQNINKAQLNS